MKKKQPEQPAVRDHVREVISATPDLPVDALYIVYPVGQEPREDNLSVILASKFDRKIHNFYTSKGPPPTINEELPGTRVELGYVAWDTQRKKAYSGGQYSAGAKVYKSGPSASSAVSRQRTVKWMFLPAYIQLPESTEPSE